MASNEKKVVSVVIPTLNSENYIVDCLKSIRNQSYEFVEIIVVDGGSTDRTVELAKKYADKVLMFNTRILKEGHFTATHQRNYGVKNSSGQLVFYVDADMILTRDVILNCVKKIEEGFDAVVVPEESFGKGFWANCKRLERRCYWGDNTVEAARFIRRDVWDRLGGLDESLGAGGDDWDLHQRLLESGYKIARVNSLILHNEGNLSLSKLVRKRFMYGKDIPKYIRKRPKKALISYFPVRIAFIRNRKLFVNDPIHGLGVVFMKTIEYLAGLIGFLTGVFSD